MSYAFDQLSPGKHNSLPQCWASAGPVVIVNQFTQKHIAMPVIYKLTFSLRRFHMEKGQSMVKLTFTYTAAYNLQHVWFPAK